ncbi:transposase [Candidatus Palauibacter sp.]|uniref:transposase n=1 Tax=Candidatus Palauibacter sp. TaxID=3101350 RepID=UPI003B526B9F
MDNLFCDTSPSSSRRTSAERGRGGRYSRFSSTATRTDTETPQGFVLSRTKDGATVYTSEHGGYCGLPSHETVRHSVGEYVREQAHTNGVESFWALLKRGYHGVYHDMSVKHLQRYVDEFAGRYSIRNADTIRQIEVVVVRLVGRRLLFRVLTGKAEA